jgi:hypothetical protein
VRRAGDGDVVEVHRVRMMMSARSPPAGAGAVRRGAARAWMATAG